MTPLRINCPPTWKNIVISSPGVLLHQKISHRSIQLPCASVLLRSVVIERGDVYYSRCFYRTHCHLFVCALQHCEGSGVPCGHSAGAAKRRKASTLLKL